MSDITAWERTKEPGAETVTSRVVGGVLCRWWGDGSTPEGVVLINRAVNGPPSSEASQAGLKFCCKMDEKHCEEIARLRNVISRCFESPVVKQAWYDSMGPEEFVPDDAVELATYRRALETIIRDGSVDPVQVAHEAIMPHTEWFGAEEFVAPATPCCMQFESCKKVCIPRYKWRTEQIQIQINKGVPVRLPTPIAINEDELVATLVQARHAASVESAEPLYSHRGWRAMLRAALYYVDRYYELIYQVGIKWPGETRHQTALRYLREREAPKPDQTANAKVSESAHD